jgi:hypothetical protein
MDFKTLHAKFKDDDSPSVEGQIRWLQKHGFSQSQIDQAMVLFYTDVEKEKLPVAYELFHTDGKLKETVFCPVDVNRPSKEHKQREILNGWDFDQALLDYAKRVRTEELSAMISHMEQFEKKLRNKFYGEVPWYKRVFGAKPKDHK